MLRRVGTGQYTERNQPYGADAPVMPVRDEQRWTPEKKLQAAVLEEAIETLRKYGRGRQGRELTEEVKRWMFASRRVDRASPFTFLAICESLLLDPEAVIEQMIREGVIVKSLSDVARGLNLGDAHMSIIDLDQDRRRVYVIQVPADADAVTVRDLARELGTALEEIPKESRPAMFILNKDVDVGVIEPLSAAAVAAYLKEQGVALPEVAIEKLLQRFLIADLST